MIRKKKQPTKAIVLSQAPEIIIKSKFELWSYYFFNKNNKETYLNATQSALKSYDTKKYFNAGRIGYDNSKKLQKLKLTWLDMKGFGFGKRMEIGLSKARSGSYSDWEKFMVVVGEFKEKPAALIQNNYDFSNLGADINKSLIERGLQPI